MMKHLGMGLAVFALLLMVVVSADAGPVRSDLFNAQILPNGVVEGSGSGWDNGRFVYYPESGWWNEWFYNDPPSPDRWKWIDYDIMVNPASPGGVIEIAINWSTMAWPETGPVGPPPGGITPLTLAEEGLYIVRETVYLGPVTIPTCYRSSELGQIVIPDYNPEWVSIDIRLVDGAGMVDPILISGCIDHQCVPEPSTLLLLGLGTLALVFTRRSR